MRYIIQPDDIGILADRPMLVCGSCGTHQSLVNFTTPCNITEKDVGKICFKVDGYWIMETESEFLDRVWREYVLDPTF